jgi:hypothetical protein
MTVLERMLDVLPPPYTVAPDSVLAALLDDVALEAEVLAEDLDRMRRTHWVGFAYRFADVDRIADLVGVRPLPGEALESFRVRLLALVAAQLHGAVGPAEIRTFVHSYLVGAERALRSTFVPDLTRYDATTAFAADGEHPHHRPLALVENPLRERRSAALDGIGGRVPYLFDWQEHNRGLHDAVACFAITGMAGGRTAVPLLVNRTTRDLIGYRGVLRVGQRLELAPADGEPQTREAVALLDGHDVTARVFSVSGFEPGVPFEPGDLDPVALLPRMRGRANEWTYLSVGLYDVAGLNRVFYAIADDTLREGVFDDTSFDHAILHVGPVAQLEMTWTEVEPASFEVHVPRYMTILSPEAATGPAHELVEDALRSAIADIHAAGVRAAVVFDALRETQPQRVSVTLPWIVVAPEAAPSGEDVTLSFGARFGESGLDDAKFE